MSLQLEIQIEILTRCHFNLDDRTLQEDNTKGTEEDVQQRQISALRGM